jgi:hypothetical protein
METTTIIEKINGFLIDEFEGCCVVVVAIFLAGWRQRSKAEAPAA